jgi:hypothetical protein
LTHKLATELPEGYTETNGKVSGVNPAFLREDNATDQHYARAKSIGVLTYWAPKHLTAQ